MVKGVAKILTSLFEKEFISMLKEDKNDFYKLAYSYVKNEQDALDVIGEATYKALNSLHGLKNRQYMKTWFYRILINESISLIRKNKRVVYNSEVIETITYDGVDKDEMIDLYNALDELNEDQKNVIILKYMKGFKLTEIAETLELNVNTIKSRLKRGIEKLKEITGR